MQANETTNFKGLALTNDYLRSQAPSIFASGPMTGVSDSRRDRRGRVRSVRALNGIDSKIDINKGLWGLAERIVNGEPLEVPSIALN